MRNFNFYILVTGALVAGYTKLPSQQWSQVLEIAGMLSSLLFFGLDVRSYSFHRRSALQMATLEPLVWEAAGIADCWTKIPGYPGNAVVSHRTIYRAFFLLTGAAWAVALVLHPDFTH